MHTLVRSSSAEDSTYNIHDLFCENWKCASIALANRGAEKERKKETKTALPPFFLHTPRLHLQRSPVTMCVIPGAPRDAHTCTHTAVS